MLKKTTMLLLISVLPLGGVWGCASKYGEQTTDVVRFPQCYAPIKQLRDDESSVHTSTAAGAVGGALLGAVVGALTTGKVSGAVAGAVAGGALGAGAGYASGKAQEEREQNVRMAAYLKDLDGDISGLNAVTASARHSIQCYDREFRTIIVNYKSGKLNKLELQDAYNEIKNGIGESERILGETLQKAYDRDAQYQAAINSEVRQGRSSTASKKAPAGRVAGASPTDAVQAKQVAYKKTIKEGEKARQEAQKTRTQHEEELRIITG
jgi:outer membrane lipoprotein SlyB